DLEQTYLSGGKPLTVLKQINLAVEPEAFVAIIGPSGSGKTTLLGLLAGQDLGSLSEDQRARLRADKVGFVFQTFQLIPTLTALENVLVPIELRGNHSRNGTELSDRAEALLERVGLADRMDHYPTQLSGGEQQRVGLARAFASAPKILMA